MYLKKRLLGLYLPAFFTVLSAWLLIKYALPPDASPLYRQISWFVWVFITSYSFFFFYNNSKYQFAIGDWRRNWEATSLFYIFFIVLWFIAGLSWNMSTGLISALITVFICFMFSPLEHYDSIPIFFGMVSITLIIAILICAATALLSWILQLIFQPDFYTFRKWIGPIISLITFIVYGMILFEDHDKPKYFWQNWGMATGCGIVFGLYMATIHYHWLWLLASFPISIMYFIRYGLLYFRSKKSYA